ncbi:unnamed protein product [Ambrosiozyma monospora]|uniref:Unnamed protein product n=1 Tax=Ambrosiozyma monospora TaxID=43982 RepID=A0ACB5TJK6_AMBMO|nr:unnamed protein product [Ambrosiozyma monospora]
MSETAPPLSKKQEFEVSQQEQENEKSYPDSIPTGSGTTATRVNEEGDISYLKDTDVALMAKYKLINDAIDEIGFTWYHFGLFCLTGFGYAADSLVSMIQSAVQTYAVYYQYNFDYPISTEFCYFGLFAGAVAIGFTSDLIGRKTAFNCSLILSAVFGFMAGGSSSLAMYMVNMFMANFFLGGNLALDVTLLLEFLPSKWQHLNTFLACWWGVGQTICELIAWGFIPNFSCSVKGACPMHENRGWRYTWYAGSGLVLVMGLARVLFFQLHETPKHLVSTKRDAEAVRVLQELAAKHNRQCSLTIEDLQRCGEISINDDFISKASFSESMKQIWHHVKLLFLNKTVARSNVLLIISWFGIGITYGIYNNFLYAFLASQGASTGSSTHQIYRDATIECFFSIFGPIIAAYLMLIPKVGRRGTLVIGGVSSMILLMCYTKVRDEAANVSYWCCFVFGFE